MTEASPGYVLLVDDHEDGRELLGEFLSMNGFTVESAGTGEEALALVASRGTPSVVITDLSLGEMHGTDLARRVRERSASVPIIAVTGHAGYEDTDALFTAVLVKPVVLGVLVDTVTRALGH